MPKETTAHSCLEFLSKSQRKVLLEATDSESPAETQSYHEIGILRLFLQEKDENWGKNLEDYRAKGRGGRQKERVKVY